MLLTYYWWLSKDRGDQGYSRSHAPQCMNAATNNDAALQSDCRCSVLCSGLDATLPMPVK